MKVDTLFCLFAHPPGTVVLQHVVRLAGSLRATVCVLRGREVSPVLDRLQRERRRMFAPPPIGFEEKPKTGDPTEVKRLIRSCTETAEGRSLVVVSSGAGQGPVPPRADPFVRGLVHRLDFPVVVLHGDRSPEDVHRLRVPTDFSNASVETLAVAAALAEVYEADVDLLHVIEKNPYVALTPKDRLSLTGPTLAERRARNRFREIVTTRRLSENPIQLYLRFGEPVDEIATFAHERAVDMVVLSTPRREPRVSRPVAAVSARVLRRVARPFVLVPSSRYASEEGQGDSFMDSARHGDE